MKKLLAYFCATLFSFFVIVFFPLVSISQPKTEVGINLSYVTDWSSAWVFTDAFKQSRSWISQCNGCNWGEGSQLHLDQNGWIRKLDPNQYAETVIFTDTESQYPSGKYTLLYDGEGEIKFDRSNATIVDTKPGRILVDIKPHDAGIWLQLVKTNEKNYVRNIRLIMPGFEQSYKTQIFHPKFLERLQPFNTLRFMDWTRTNNNSLVVDWEDRPKITDSTQSTDLGVALEYQIALANKLNDHAWFTIPHLASDDYVRKFALAIKNNLKPNLKAYVEYSNEIWNYQFTQTKYVQEKGTELNLSDDVNEAGLRFYSQRAVETFKIARPILGNRLVATLAAQSANPGTGEVVLGWKNASKFTNAYAIAPYFGHSFSDRNIANQTANKNPNQIIDGLLHEINTEYKKSVIANKKLANKYKVSLVAYEGGQHLTSYDFPSDVEPKVTELFQQVNRHQRMYQIYTTYLRIWKENGGGLFNIFSDIGTWNKFGCWSLLECQTTPINESPKYRAVVDFVRKQ